jgi:hypothetical protein|nr:MAG TPA: Putative tail fiber protein [Caudoviricetes sp.]
MLWVNPDKNEYMVEDAEDYVVKSTIEALNRTDQIKDALLEHEKKEDNPHKVTKEQVGLSNVDNTSDADKPVSAATQEMVDIVLSILERHKGNFANPHEVTSAQVGLPYVENTSDMDKPISRATSIALRGLSDAYQTHKTAQVLEHPDASVTGEKIADGAIEKEKLTRELADSLMCLKGPVTSNLKNVTTPGIYPVWNANGGTANGYPQGERYGVLFVQPFPDGIMQMLLSVEYSNADYMKLYTRVFANNIEDLDTTWRELSVKAHADCADNPHRVTKAQVGLSNVDNTADIDKPVSDAVAAEIAALAARKMDFNGTAERKAAPEKWGNTMVFHRSFFYKIPPDSPIRQTKKISQVRLLADTDSSGAYEGMMIHLNAFATTNLESFSEGAVPITIVSDGIHFADNMPAQTIYVYGYVQGVSHIAGSNALWKAL